WEIGTELLKEKIRVPAGTFSNCLKNCTMVNGENLADVLLKNAAPVYSEREGEKCFRTESFYVKDIGLVKEVQYNAKNKVTYQLELIEYKTNK
ncbi:MAG: hypothetical protein HYY56_00475, partial [Candidatus Omnitrophica bacterium]|nr:hypothetical protein [Candidatus Omnitrophota bacterium]